MWCYSSSSAYQQLVVGGVAGSGVGPLGPGPRRGRAPGPLFGHLLVAGGVGEVAGRALRMAEGEEEEKEKASTGERRKKGKERRRTKSGPSTRSMVEGE